MKLVILIVSFCIVSSSFAAEVGTNCDAMNGNREKIIKTVKTKTNTKGSSAQ